MNRDEAKSLGLMEYMPDFPCGNGHVSVRLTANDRCRQCQKEWAPRSMECKIDGCDRNAHWTAGGSKGYCRAHRLRLARHGDPLAGGTYWGEPLRWLQEHVTYEGKECLIYPFGSEGALGKIVYDGKSYKAARLMCVLKHGLPPSEIHEAAHSCGKRHEGCCNPNHLRWALPVENAADKILHGTHMRGEDQNGAKLDRDEVREIRRLFGIVPHAVLADRFGVSEATITNIGHRDSWAWLDDPVAEAIYCGQRDLFAEVER